MKEIAHEVFHRSAYLKNNYSTIFYEITEVYEVAYSNFYRSAYLNDIFSGQFS